MPAASKSGKAGVWGGENDAIGECYK
jgi:hypothetical protein